MLTKKNRVWAVVALLTVAIGFSSCLKNDNNITPTRPQAQIMFLNVSNNAVPASFYDNDQRISSDTTSIGFNFYSRYAVYGGPHKFELRKKGGDSVITSNITTYDSITSTGNYAYYTYLIYGNNPVRSVSIPTSLADASSTKINIRFFNLSQGTDPVDFYIGSEKVDSNRTTMAEYDLRNEKFKQFSSFSVNNTVTVKKAGSDVVLATANSSQLLVTSFNTNAMYTVYFAGTAGSLGKDKLMVNAFYSLY